MSDESSYRFVARVRIYISKTRYIVSLRARVHRVFPTYIDTHTHIYINIYIYISIRIVYVNASIKARARECFVRTRGSRVGARLINGSASDVVGTRGVHRIYIYIYPVTHIYIERDNI